MSSIFNDYTTSATQNYILPKVIDSVLDSNVLTAKLLGNPKKFRGETFDVNVRVGISNASAAQGGSFRGTDTFVTQVQDEQAQMSFNPKYVYEPLNFVFTDLSVNTGDEEVLSIVQRETEFSFSNLLNTVGTQFYGTGGDTSKDLTGLRHIVSASTAYGGLNRASTYTVLQPGDTSGTGVDTSTTTLTLAAMRTLSNALDSGSVRTDLIVTTPAVFGYYEDLLTPMQRLDIGGFTQVTRDGLAANKGDLGAATGFDALMWNGIPIVRDETCTAAHMFFLNMKFLDFYRLDGFASQFDWKQISFRPDVVQGQYSENAESGHKTPFHWSGFKEPTNQASVTSQLVLAGELITTNPRRQGGFTAITGS